MEKKNGFPVWWLVSYTVCHLRTVLEITKQVSFTKNAILFFSEIVHPQNRCFRWLTNHTPSNKCVKLPVIEACIEAYYHDRCHVYLMWAQCTLTSGLILQKGGLHFTDKFNTTRAVLLWATLSEFRGNSTTGLQRRAPTQPSPSLDFHLSVWF